MKHSKLFVCLSVLVLIFSLISCSDNINTQESGSVFSSKALFEMEKLASEDELNELSSRGDDDIVDWQLSREFAQLWLESGIEAGDYPEDSQLWEIPIAVYNADGEIQYYEFRVTSKGEVVAAIVGAARKEFGCPIVYEFLTDGYSDEITQLYNSGKFSSETLPRVVDNGYPTVVFGTTTITRGTDDGFDEFINPETGDPVNAEDIVHLLTYEEAKTLCPEMFEDAADDAKMQAMVDDFNKNGEDFWNMAVANKGHIADFAVRGGSKSSPRQEVDSSRLNQVRRYLYNHKYRTNYNDNNHRWSVGLWNYGEACATVAAGYILDFISANNLQRMTAWDKLDIGVPLKSERKDAMYREMNVWSVYNLRGQWIGDAVWPWDLGNSISKYSDYYVTPKLVVPSVTDVANLIIPVDHYPKKSINNNMPGISLRLLGSNDFLSAHYRPVVAYKDEGWLIFTWQYNRILDLVDASDKINGSWEAWRPLIYSFDVLHK